jgi:hypothetical protein
VRTISLVPLILVAQASCHASEPAGTPGRHPGASDWRDASSGTSALDGNKLEEGTCRRGPAEPAELARLPGVRAGFIMGNAIAVPPFVYASLPTLAGSSRGGPITNHIYRVSPFSGAVELVETARFNTSALASDGARLYYTVDNTSPGTQAKHIVTILRPGDGGAVDVESTAWSIPSESIVEELPIEGGATEPVGALHLSWLGQVLEDLWCNRGDGVTWTAIGANARGTFHWDPHSRVTTTVLDPRDGFRIVKAVDDDNVYWADLGRTAIYATPLSGGPSVIVGDFGGPITVYAANRSELVYKRDDVLVRFDRSTRSDSVLASPADLGFVPFTCNVVSPWAYCVDNYFERLARVGLQGGRVEQVAAQPDRRVISPVAGDKCNIYWLVDRPPAIFWRRVEP